jgi:hypothetical protein
VQFLSVPNEIAASHKTSTRTPWDCGLSVQGWNMMTRVIVLFAMATSAAVSAGCANGPTIDQSTPIPTCEGLQLEPAVELLISPVLLSFAEESDESFEAALHKLLASNDSRAVEAQVALMAYYIGEHPGEELIESLLNRTTEADPLIAKYGVCRPPLSIERQLRSVVVLRTKYDTYTRERKRVRKDG